MGMITTINTREKAPYRVEAPRCPAEIPADYSATDIQLLLRQWVKDAEDTGKISDLVKVVKTLGEKGEPYPYLKREPFVRFKQGAYTLHYKETTTITNKNEVFSGEFFTLVVTQGGREGYELIDGFKLVNYFGLISIEDHWDYQYRIFAANRPTADGVEGNLYLPGDWELYFLGGPLSLANETLGVAAKKQAQEERATLIRAITPPEV